MFHLLLKKITPMYKIICLFVLLLFISGCVTAEGNHAYKNIKSADLQKQDITNKKTLRQINSIDILPGPDAIEILIRGNQKLTYTSVKQSFPLGIAIYLPETGIDGCSVGKLPEKTSIRSISVSYAGGGKINAKVEILLRKNLDYEVRAENTELKIKIYNNDITLSDNQELNGKSPEINGNIAENKHKETAALSSYKISDTPATLTGIDFTTKENGNSDINIKTSHPVKYTVLREKNKHKLVLTLNNTDIPKYRQRPFVTEYFRSAVNRIIPMQRQKGEKSSRVVIEMREDVPYRIARNNDGLLLSFEPSSIPPVAFTKAKRILQNNKTHQMFAKRGRGVQNTDLNGGDGQSESNEAWKNQENKNMFTHKKIYTGEKIKVDFFETDIKNVFRILAGVSQKNLAVDKDVRGNVTLSLDKPVPWDQVLDLVLKMNNLGEIQEGSIIRIATRATLKREEEFRQAEFTARKNAIEQQKSLEPLVTEYIPINYANAGLDIKPHLAKILTPKRGHLSVDERTNMIIMTDVREKINQAKEIIAKLDKVTPQIMIAARIVEVTKNFSRQLGIDWSITRNDNDSPKNTRNFSLAMNYPVASTGSIGYTFSHLSKSPLVLDATLSASEVKGDVKIISSPKILTLDNKKAKIKQGLQYPYLERDDSGGSSVKFKDIDLLLEVTPHVTPDKRIAMSVHLTKDDVASITNGVPSLSTNEADTELLINDGDTIVIGGITKASIHNDKTGFPGLSSLPVLGNLFSSKTKSNNRNELLIFITPSIVQLQQAK